MRGTKVFVMLLMVVVLIGCQSEAYSEQDAYQDLLDQYPYYQSEYNEKLNTINTYKHPIHGFIHHTIATATYAGDETYIIVLAEDHRVSGIKDLVKYTIFKVSPNEIKKIAYETHPVIETEL